MPLDMTAAELTQQTNQIHTPQLFITSLFFGETDPVSTEAVKITATKGGRQAAPYVSPLVSGKAMKKAGTTVATFTPPLVKPKYRTESEEILKAQTLMFGDGKDAEERAVDQLISDEEELKRMKDRTVEIQCVAVALQGKFTAKGEGVEEEFDYQRDASSIEVLTGSDLWSDAASDPLKDIREWHKAVRDRTGIAPNALVMGLTAEDAFMSHAKVLDAFDKKNIKVGDIQPRILTDANGEELPGVVWLGRYTRTNTDIYAYSDQVVLEAGAAAVEVFPADKVVYGRANAGGKVSYGALTDSVELPGQIFVGEQFIKSYTQDDPDAEFLLLKSKPIAQPADVDGFQTATVV